jgi:hypothetical protein
MVAILLASREAARGQASGGVILYRGDSLANSGVTLAGWGSGAATEDSANIFSGSHSIKITTQGLMQGARVIFGHPVDLAPYVNNKFDYLELPCLLPQTAGTRTGPGARGGGGLIGAGGLSGPAGGQSGRGRRIGGRGSAKTAKVEHNLTYVRAQLVMSDDRVLDILLPIEDMAKDNRWTLLAIPVPAISGISTGATQVKEVRLFGDQPCTMYLGAIRIVEDANPIIVEPMEEAVFPTNDKHLFTAHASAGVTPLHYSWDWNSADGIQAEAEGPTIRHAYYHEGDYTATLTVTDIFGSKQPVVTTFHVKITP